MDELLNALFSEIEISIENCPPELEGAEVEYDGLGLQVMGIVRNGKLVTETVDEIPENTTIVWGKGSWRISFS